VTTNYGGADVEQNWEDIQHQRDLATVERINKCNRKKSRCLLLGAVFIILAYSVFYTACDNLGKALNADPSMTVRKFVTETASGQYTAVVILFLIGLFFLLRSMFRWEESEKLAASRFMWIPDEEEIAYIEQRFDNDLISFVLKAISPVDTKAIEVGFSEITIRSNDGDYVCNYNKCGYSHLSNYGTKQLAYYLASHSFPEGFTIYQTKIVPPGAEQYIGGYTDIGGQQQPQARRIRRYVSMLNWLAVQLQEMLRLKTPFKMPDPKPGPSPTDNGQLVINKGYRLEKKGMKEL